MCELIKLHPFLHGVKRTGLLAMIVFLEQNGKECKRNINAEVDVSIKTAICTLNVSQLTS